MAPRYFGGLSIIMVYFTSHLRSLSIIIFISLQPLMAQIFRESFFFLIACISLPTSHNFYCTSFIGSFSIINLYFNMATMAHGYLKGVFQL